MLKIHFFTQKNSHEILQLFCEIFYEIIAMLIGLICHVKIPSVRLAFLRSEIY